MNREGLIERAAELNSEEMIKLVLENTNTGEEKRSLIDDIVKEQIKRSKEKPMTIKEVITNLLCKAECIALTMEYKSWDLNGNSVLTKTLEGAIHMLNKEDSLYDFIEEELGYIEKNRGEYRSALEIKRKTLESGNEFPKCFEDTLLRTRYSGFYGREEKLVEVVVNHYKDKIISSPHI